MSFAIITVKRGLFIKLKKMKNLILKSILAVLIASATTVRAQNYPSEYLGLPGDNLNLYAVMDLFRNSETLEGFERSLNNPNSRINNLDLNGDNLVDYITVSDYVSRKVHTIVLRTALGRNEYQDVAVFTVQKMGKRKVMIQLIGDEALYGPNYIIEPLIAKRPKQNFYSTPVYDDNVTVINNYYWDVYEWPMIAYIYNPNYHGWHSSWHWGYYPDWWSPWSPYYWDFYYGYQSCWDPYYYTWYHHWDHPRYNGYHDHYYQSIRQQSPQVHQRLAEGRYRDTYGRPEQRSEGAALYNRTRAERSDPGRRPAEASETRRSASPVATQNNGTGRRPVAVPGTRETDRRAIDTRGSEVRSAQTRETERSESEKRNATARAAEERETQAREAQRMESERREVASRASEERSAQAREAASRASEERSAQAREAASRASEERSAQAREAASRASEERATQAREAASRASEERATQAREAASRASEERSAQAREAASRAAEERSAQAREAASRASEERSAQAREAASRSAEVRRSEIRTTSEEKPTRPDRR